MTVKVSLPINRFGCAAPTFWLWLLFFYPLRFVVDLMPVMRQMLGPWAELNASVWYLPSSLTSLLLLYTCFNRIPEAGDFWRFIWRWGRWFLIAVYLWSLVALLCLHGAVLLRPDHRHFEALLVLAAIDLAALAYLLRSYPARALFVEFPVPLDGAVQREAEQFKAKARQQLIREARLWAPIAKTAAQEPIEAHWREETKKHPASALPWLELGVLAYQTGQQEQALCLMESAYECEPGNAVVLRNLCELYRQQGRVGKSTDYGRQAVERAPSDATARLHYALALVDAHEHTAAIEQYHKLIDLDPNNIQAWSSLLDLLLKTGRVQDARIAVEAIKLIDAAHPVISAFEKKFSQ